MGGVGFATKENINTSRAKEGVADDAAPFFAHSPVPTRRILHDPRSLRFRPHPFDPSITRRSRPVARKYYRRRRFVVSFFGGGFGRGENSGEGRRTGTIGARAEEGKNRMMKV